MELIGKRKRAALWTIGRGSRGLLRFSTHDSSYVIAGTTTTGHNSVHLLRVDEHQNSFTPVCVYGTEAQVWSIELVEVKDHFVHVIVVTRRKRQSFAEVWSLSLDNARTSRASDPSPASSIDEAMPPVERKSSVKLTGNGITVKRGADRSRQYLVITDSRAIFVEVSEVLDAKISISWNCEELSDNSGDCWLVDGGWITDRQVFVASHNAVGIFDSSTGHTEALLKPSLVLEKSASESEELGIPLFISRITSACCGRENRLYIGGQDGSLRAFDVRTAGELSNRPEADGGTSVSLPSIRSGDETHLRVSQMRWEAVKGHSQWVSVLCPMPHGGVLSGSVDGVVRCWAEDGSPSGTFPQHVDTVTSATTSTKSFVTVSYDGRIALNQILIGA